MKVDYENLHGAGFFEEDFRPSVRARNVFIRDILKDIQGESVLDIGAGSGGFDRILEVNNSVVTMDLSLLAMKKAKNALLNPKCAVSSADSLPFKDNSFTIVMIMDVIEHIENREAVLNEIYRILKKDGILLISVPEDMKLYNSVDKEVGHFIRFTKNNLVDMLGNKFKVKWLSDLGYPFMRIYYKLLPLFHNRAVKMAEKEAGSFFVKLVSRIIYMFFFVDFLFRGNFKGILIFGIFQKTEK